MSANRSNDDLEALGACLRRLPDHPVPDGLEAKLISAIPEPEALAASRTWQSRGGRGLYVAGLIAAAALLAMVIHSFVQKPIPDQGLPLPQPTQELASYQLPAQPFPRLSSLDVASTPTSFEWPVQLTVSSRAQRLPVELTN
jgi:hypothetical protein